MTHRLPAFVVMFCLTAPSLGARDKAVTTYPPTEKTDQHDVIHGVDVADPYRWLEEAKDASVQRWTAAENDFTRAVLGRVPGRAALHDRLGKLLETGTLGTPTPRKGRYFYTQRQGTQNQPVLYARDGLNGEARALVDPNKLSTEGTTSLDWYVPSRDGKLLAFGLSENGNEESVLHVHEAETGARLSDVIDRCRACSLAWLPDSSGFYYTRYPAAGSVPAGEERYHRYVYLHMLGTDPAKDDVVFGPGRAKEDWCNVDLSPDGRWLVVTVEQGWAKSEIFFKDLKVTKGRFVPLVEKVDALFDVIVRNGAFYVRTNHEAPKYKLYKADPTRPGRQHWAEVLPEGADVLDGVTVIGDRLVAMTMHNAASRLRVHDLDGKHLKDVALPTLGTLAGLGGEADGSELFYGFQSFTVAPAVYRVDLKTLEGALWKQVDADIDSSAYQVEQVTYRSKDGTPVTMFLASKKGLKRDGSNPTVLWAYGGFNISITPTFSPSRFVFLERGGVIAIPNLRGGGEYGEEWHQAGMLGKKQNVFDDFIAAAEFLVAEKYTSPRRLVIEGRSNGGLLVGAALTQRPDLYKAVVCGVPLLDMVRYHRFLIARLWIPEYGSSETAEAFKWLYAYSPYHHVKDGVTYPAVLIEAAESDTRVDALHARKMVARLQAATSAPPASAPVLLRLETKAGHGAGKPRAKVLEELTDTWSFVFWQLGLATGS